MFFFLVPDNKTLVNYFKKNFSCPFWWLYILKCAGKKHSRRNFGSCPRWWSIGMLGVIKLSKCLKSFLIHTIDFDRLRNRLDRIFLSCVHLLSQFDFLFAVKFEFFFRYSRFLYAKSFIFQRQNNSYSFVLFWLPTVHCSRMLCKSFVSFQYANLSILA
jgi:hypothetical protein